MVREALRSTSVYGGDFDSYLFVADVFGYAAFPPAHLLGGLTRGIYSRLTGNPWEATPLCETEEYRTTDLCTKRHGGILHPC